MDPQDFFTEGQGVRSIEVNDATPEDNLIDSNAWNPITPRDPRAVGGTTMDSMNMPTSTPIEVGQGANPDLAKMPSTLETPNAFDNSAEQNRPSELGKIELVAPELPPDITEEELNKTTEESTTEEKAQSRLAEITPMNFYPVEKGDKSTLSRKGREVLNGLVHAFKAGEIDPATLNQSREKCRKYFQKKDEGEAA